LPLLLTEMVIWGLFAVSLDLILGYAGIISLGHAAFFGVGAYAAGLLAKYELINDPTLALLPSVLAGGGAGVARVRLEHANHYGETPGGADGLQGVTIAPILGTWRFDMFGHTAYIYCLV